METLFQLLCIAAAPLHLGSRRNSVKPPVQITFERIKNVYIVFSLTVSAL